VCRPAAGACDVDDHCSGTSAGCPADERAAAGEVCRPAVDGCDAMETCDGTSADCPPDARAPDVDGDGVCDVRDVCQAVSNGSQSDVDGDGLGDECDPCTNVLPVTLLKPRLQMTRLATPPGDDRMRFTAAMQFPVPVSPTIDPMVKGIRLLLMSSHDVPMVDTLLPGGGYNPAADAGWRAQHGGRTWVYRNGGLGTATINGIRRAVVKLALRPGKARVRVTLVGRNGRYPVHVTDMPVKAIVVIDAPLARQGQCGEALLPLPGCRYDEQRGKMRCRG